MTFDRPPLPFRLMLVLLLSGGLASTALAQGGVRGVVRGDDGEGIPGASIIAERLET